MTVSGTAFAAEWHLTGDTRVVCTGWGHGDMAGSGATGDGRRQSVVDLPWTLLRQVHGARVVNVDQPGAATGEPADAMIATCPGAALAVLTADCAPIAFASPEGLVAVAHAGWKGLRAGVVEATVQGMRRLGATRVEAVVGPCIHPCCYTFGADELMEIESRHGRQMGAVDRDGRPALDLPAWVRTALHSAGAKLVGEAGACTGCHDGLWSWRTGQTTRRQATVAWRL